MKRKYDTSKINLCIDHWKPFVNDTFMGFWIEWSSDIGFGEYTIFKPVHPKSKEDNIWMGASEYMDTNEDKAFLKELMKLLVEDIEVVG